LIAYARTFRSAVLFGPFEADFAGRELLKSGSRVKLQEQQFQLLAALLEHPGEVVTRDQLRQRIWPSDTFVDFERGLNKAVNRLRESLGDPAEHPKFIETVPRRGYRFIAKVTPKIGSLAVLPLENLSGDPNHEHWANGLTDELITHVAKIAGLRVISRTSAMQFNRSSKPLAEIASELGVDALVVGSVVVSDRGVRIRIQLIDPFRDQHLWAESYERELSEIASLQTQIAQAISRQIRARLTPAEHSFPIGKRRVSPEAYEAYLKGRYFLTKGTGVERSLEYFSKAIAADPDYAAPYAGLADCYVLLGVLYLRPPHAVFPEAKKFAEGALQRDGAVAEAHKSLAVVRNLYDWDWAGSEEEFKRAFELNPSLSDAHQAYSILLSCLRRYEEAVEEALKARELDPLSVTINALVGFIYARASQYDKAIEACHQAIELDPNNPFGNWLLARSLDAADRTDEALAISQKTAKLSGNRSPYAGHLGYALARAGHRSEASKVVEDLHKRQTTEYVSPYEFVNIYIALGETDLALEWLEKAYEERTPRLSGELWDRPFDALRPDPRFQDLMRRIGLRTCDRSP
jgi:TolB-like protein/Tfp pilus assembly protein PilF